MQFLLNLNLVQVLIFFTLLHHRRQLLLVVQKCHCNNPAQTYFALLRPIRCIYHCCNRAKQWTSFHFWFGHGLLFDTPLMNLTILVISSAPKTVAEIKHGKKLSCFKMTPFQILFSNKTDLINQSSKKYLKKPNLRRASVFIFELSLNAFLKEF